jgi:glyoxylase-like metal-dependent hydrolase (beta-lactamase superfamily II)
LYKLSENVIQLGNRHFNYFLVGQKEAAIIECGVTGGVLSLEKQWNEMSSRPNIKFLFAMHAHFDHVCGIPKLKELFPQAKVLGSNEAQKVLNKPKIVEDFFYQDEMMSELLLNEGILQTKHQSSPYKTITFDQIISEGEEIALAGNLKIKVLDAPGHSPCGLACYLPEEQVMFLSDAAGFQISDNEIFPIFFQSYEIYMETIMRLMGLPTRILCPPHEKIWVNSNVQDFYQRALDSARWAFNTISHMLDDGWDEEKMMQTLFQHYYRGNLKIYTTKNINTCIQLLIRRVKESLR